MDTSIPIKDAEEMQYNTDENDDNIDELYHDIELKTTAVELENLHEELEEEKKKSATLEEEKNQVIAQLNAILEEKSQLESHILALYNTALLEMKRKDKEIKELQQTIINASTKANP